MSKQTVKDVDVNSKRVLLRADFNVPLDKTTNLIPDDSRIVATLPTIRYAIDKKAKVILCSHLGRPKGTVVEEMRLAPVANHLSALLGTPVAYVKDCTGKEVEKAVRQLKPGQVLLLENLRFCPGEEKNDPEFARALASLADVYVNDAFGAAHRAHASIVGVAHYLPAVAGFLMERELEMLGKTLSAPSRPFAAICGGAKIRDKIAVLENLLRKVDILLVGGGMAATFLKSKGLEVGKSHVEDECIDFARELLRQVAHQGSEILLPVDVVVADSFSQGAEVSIVSVGQIPPSAYIMDIGPQTASLFERELRRCKTVLWNGPMGVFEWKPFDVGTRRIAEVLATLKDCTTVVGGGSTAQAVDSLGLASNMTHISTGGGASLEFLEGKVLPGVVVLRDKVQ